jgi:hypothetical protein
VAFAAKSGYVRHPGLASAGCARIEDDDEVDEAPPVVSGVGPQPVLAQERALCPLPLMASGHEEG